MCRAPLSKADFEVCYHDMPRIMQLYVNWWTWGFGYRTHRKPTTDAAYGEQGHQPDHKTAQPDTSSPQGSDSHSCCPDLPQAGFYNDVMGKTMGHGHTEA
jgi:hypothetical protein